MAVFKLQVAASATFTREYIVVADTKQEAIDKHNDGESEWNHDYLENLEVDDEDFATHDLTEEVK